MALSLIDSLFVKRREGLFSYWSKLTMGFQLFSKIALGSSPGREAKKHKTSSGSCKEPLQPFFVG